MVAFWYASRVSWKSETSFATEARNVLGAGILKKNESSASAPLLSDAISSSSTTTDPPCRSACDAPYSCTY